MTTTTTTTTYRVDGLRSAVQMAAVIERVATWPGITEVGMELVLHAASRLTIHGSPEPSPDQVRSCLKAAGARLAEPLPAAVSDTGNSGDVRSATTRLGQVTRPAPTETVIA